MGLDWFNRDQNPQNGPIPIVNDRHRTIAGIKDVNLHEVIPVHRRGDIEKALKKLTLHMKYTKPNDERRENGKSTFLSVMEAQHLRF